MVMMVIIRRWERDYTIPVPWSWLFPTITLETTGPSSGPYDEIFYYIRNNVDAVRDDLAVMISGGSVPARVREYAATSQELKTKEEILSAMVVYGFLSYENGEVSIPNKEVGELLVGIGYDKKTKKCRYEVEEVFQTV